MSIRTDEDLARMAQAGDSASAEELVGRYATKKPKITEMIARSFRMPGLEMEEKVAECRLALAKAISTYERGKGTTFRTYAKRLMTNALIDRHRSANTQSAIPPGKRLSIDAPLSGDDDESPLADTIECGEAMAAFAEAETRQDAERAELEMCSMVISAMRGGNAPSWMRSAIACYARECLPQSIAADLIELLEPVTTQPRLIVLHPDRDSDEAEAVVKDALSTYLDAQRMILQDLSDGYCVREIAESLGLPKRLVRILSDASQTAGGRAA